MGIDIVGLLIPLVLIAVSCFVIWRTAKSFEIASDYLGRNLNEGIKGATINAVASSMPEFLSTIFFLFYIKDADGFSGGVGIAAGSAVYNLLVIPAGVIFYVLLKKPAVSITVKKSVALRDSIFLIATTIILIIILNFGTLNWFLGLVMVITYFIYLIYIYLRVVKNRKTEVVENKNNEYYIGDKGCVFDLFKLRLDKLIIGDKTLNSSNSWLLLIVSTITMALGTWVLVQATEWLGADVYHVPYIGSFDGMDVPILFVALILAAAASSLPDTIISIKDAGKGNYEDAFANALGSNIFDISFALGLPLLVYTLIYGPIELDPIVTTFSIGIWEILLFLTIIVTAIFVVGKSMNKAKAILLLLLYVLFLLLILGLILGNDLTMQLFDYVTSII